MNKLFIAAITMAASMMMSTDANAAKCTVELYDRYAYYITSVSRAEGCEEARQACFQKARQYTWGSFCYDTRRNNTWDADGGYKLGPGHPRQYAWGW